jgi:hypothetical protein
METHHYAWIGAAAVILIYLWLANHAMCRRMPEAMKYAQEPWTEEEMRRTYEEAQKSPVDFRSFLPPKKNRRYIVVGGSGMCVSPTFMLRSQRFLRGTPYAKTRPPVLTTPLQVSSAAG